MYSLLPSFIEFTLNGSPKYSLIYSQIASLLEGERNLEQFGHIPASSFCRMTRPSGTSPARTTLLLSPSDLLNNKAAACIAAEPAFKISGPDSLALTACRQAATEAARVLTSVGL